MAKPLADRIKEVLLEKKIISPEKLEEALKERSRTHCRLSEILIKKGFVQEENLIPVLGQELGIPLIKLKRFRPDPEVLNFISESSCRRYHILPISKIGKVLTLAMSDPLDVFALDTIKMMTGYDIKPVLTGQSELDDAIHECYEKNSKITDIKDIIHQVEEDEMEVLGFEEEKSAATLRKESEEAPVVKFVNALLSKAQKLRASDIHIEPYEHKLRIRYRIDGVLQEIISPPKKIQPAILARLKIMSGMDITEKRTPQDGRFRAIIASRNYDYRVSCLPIVRGEKIVVRILDRASLSGGLNELGFSENPKRRFEMAVSRPYGMILVTGPTGSGKSTTLYSILNKLNTTEKNIMTVEDPVEYELEGITQIQVKPEIGLTFADGLRSILRQSPDIIMVGEIRDRETADIAIKASLTGELVLSTLHTNDAPGAITRLMDMGVEPFLIASSLVLVEAQRLVRKLCKHCCAKTSLEKDVKKKFNMNTDFIFKAAGCKHCNQTGYTGRTAVIETLLITETVKELILARADADQIREAGLKEGMRTLREDGISKVEEGMTSLEEVIRVT